MFVHVSVVFFIVVKTLGSFSGILVFTFLSPSGTLITHILESHMFLRLFFFFFILFFSLYFSLDTF